MYFKKPYTFCMTTFSLIVFVNSLSFFQYLELNIQSLVVSQLTTHVPASTGKKSVSVMCARACICSMKI